MERACGGMARRVAEWTRRVADLEHAPAPPPVGSRRGRSQVSTRSVDREEAGDTMSDRFVVLGSGSWGTVLALHIASLGHEVTLWGRDPVRTKELASTRENEAYLPGF